MTDAANEAPTHGAHDRPETHDRLREVDFPDRPEGPIAAAIIAGGIGAAALGILTTMAEVSEDLKDWLDFRSEVGSLSGKTIMAVIVWLVAWVILHFVYRAKPYETRRAFVIAMVLVAVGVVGTFPTFFQAFAE